MYNIIDELIIKKYLTDNFIFRKKDVNLYVNVYLDSIFIDIKEKYNIPINTQELFLLIVKFGFYDCLYKNNKSPFSTGLFPYYFHVFKGSKFLDQYKNIRYYYD